MESFLDFYIVARALYFQSPSVLYRKKTRPNEQSAHSGDFTLYFFNSVLPTLQGVCLLRQFQYAAGHNSNYYKMKLYNTLL